MRKNNQGFTLVEMLVTATIAALLAAAGLVSYTTANRNARDAKRRSDLQQIRAAMEFYRTEEGSYPVPSDNSVSTLVGMLKPTYLSGGDFTDPRPTTYTYDYTNNTGSPTDPDCLNKAYEICAIQEKDSSQYCVCNP